MLGLGEEARAYALVDFSSSALWSVPRRRVCSGFTAVCWSWHGLSRLMLVYFFLHNTIYSTSRVLFIHSPNNLFLLLLRRDVYTRFGPFEIIGPTKTSRPSYTRRGFLWKKVERAVPCTHTRYLNTIQTNILPYNISKNTYSLIKDQ